MTLRELELADAASFHRLFMPDEVVRYLSPGPRTMEQFERFILWARRERQAGRLVCYGVVPHGERRAAGFIQVWPTGADWSTAEWGFALGSAYWGTGVFVEAARLVLAHVFTTVGVRRLQARAAVANDRGNGALRKLGARPVRTIRTAYHEQLLWIIERQD